LSARDRLFLRHILGAIDDIGQFTAEGQAVFMSDRKTQSAVVRQLEIIGEAVKQLSGETLARAPAVPWPLIAGTRDRLIHAYFSVNLDAVWSMVEQDLPPLRSQVEHLLADPDHSP
jgi:uncharacterized protein with HEPN domain